MKKILYILICFFAINLINAQPKYFEKSFAWEDVHDGVRVSTINDSVYLAIGRRLLANDLYVKSDGLKFNKYGEELFRESYPTSEGQLYVEDMEKYSNGFAIAGCMEQVAGRCVALIISLNEEGLFADLKLLADASVYSRARTIAKADDGFMIGGNIFQNQKEKLYLIKTDLEGNKVWEKIYEEYSTSQNLIKDIRPASDGGFYVLATIRLNFNTFPERGDILLMKIDEEGNKLWEKIYDIGDSDQAGFIIETSDGGFLIGGAVDDYRDPAFIKIRENLSIEWTEVDIFRNCEASAVYQLPDNTYITAGCYKPSDARLEGRIIRLAEDGSILWQRSYGGDNDEYFYDMIPTPDGGYLMCGRTQSGLTPPNANLYLVKTNCMGLLTEPQTSFSADQDPEQPLTYHFTNHSQYVYPDSIDGGHFLWDFGDGATSTDLHPSHSYANKGESRIVTLTAIVCSDTSRFDIKVITGEEIVGIEGFDGLPAFSFKMYPNPVSNGQVRIDYDLPKEGRLELYDLQGRLMVNCQLLMVNAEVELGLEELDSGMYLYRLVSEGRTLKGGKLVVED